MSFSRRRFNKLAILGGASFATTSVGIFFPKPAEAYSLNYSLRGLTTRSVWGGMLRYTTASTLGGVDSTPVGRPERSAIQSAERAFVSRDFTRDRTQLASAGTGVARSLLWGRGKLDRLQRPNVGFGFVQKYQNVASTAKISGPTMTGIHNATKVLADRRLTPTEITGSLLPTRSNFDDWGTWDGDPDSHRQGVGFASYRTPLGDVMARYELLEPGANGKGRIILTIQAAEQPRRDIIITVNFR